MPGDNSILTRWQTELETFHKNLSLLREEITTEPVHDLRVAIKKLRSYLKLYIIICGKNDIEKHFQETRKLFSVLGKHRNVEIAKGLLTTPGSKNHPIQSLFYFLQLLQEQIAPFCRQAIDLYDTNGLEFLTGQLQQDLENIDSTEISKKIKEEIESCVIAIKEDVKHFKKRSHRVRKRLKDIYYWSKIFEEQVYFNNAALKVLDKTLEDLGNIQDYEILATNLSYFRKTILPQDGHESELLKKIVAETKKTKESLLKKAQKLTERLLLADATQQE